MKIDTKKIDGKLVYYTRTLGGVWSLWDFDPYFETEDGPKIAAPVLQVGSQTESKVWDMWRKRNDPPEEAPLTIHEIRHTRDELLQKTDFLMQTDFPLAAKDKEKLAQYRQALRDFPATIDDIRDPERPAFLKKMPKLPTPPIIGGLATS